MSRVRICGAVAGAALTFAAIGSNRCLAQGFPAWAPGWGVNVSTSAEFIDLTQDGGPGSTIAETAFSTSRGTPGVADASLGGPGVGFSFMNLSASLIGAPLDGVNTIGIDTGGVMWDEITTGAVTPGSTMTITVNGTESLDGVTPFDESVVEQGVSLDLTVDKGNQSTGWAFADDHDSNAQGDVNEGESQSTLGFDGGATTAEQADQSSAPGWLNQMSTTFYVASDTTYLTYLTGSAGVVWTNDGSYGDEDITATLDPVWSLSTSGGYTYDTASGIAFGGSSPVAPEPSACSLALTGILAAWVVCRRRGCSTVR
jgi:hypothetical protein